MSNSRKNFQLKDIVNIQSGTRIFEKEYVEEGIPFYRSKEIIEKQKVNDVSTNLYISKERYNRIKQTYSVPRQGDILLTSVGTIGIPYMVRENEQFYFKDENLTWFNNFSKEIDNKYFYYWLLSEVGKEALNSILIGTTQKALTIKNLKSLEISLPPLSEQKRISSILSSFDNKIEQLKKENNILEDIAQSIFKEWFVKYNFPNKDGKPYKDNNGKMIDSELGLIPEGWRVTTYGEMEDLKNGINYSRDEHGDTVCKIINTRDIVETNYITDQNLEKINIDKEKAEKYIIDENDILIIRSASPGKVAVVQNPSGMIIYSGFIIRLSPKDINTKWYLYEDLKEKGPKLTKYSESSVMKNINQQIINNTKVIIPSTKILNKYHTIANNIHEKIWNNTLETFNVKKSKNAALNKLIK